MKTVTISKGAFTALNEARTFAPPFVGELLDEAYPSRNGFRQITYEEDQREELMGLIQFVIDEAWEQAKEEDQDGIEAVAHYIFELDHLVKRTSLGASHALPQ